MKLWMLLSYEARLAAPFWIWIFPLVLLGLRWAGIRGQEVVAELIFPLPFALLLYLANTREQEGRVLEAWLCTPVSKAIGFGLRWAVLILWLLLGTVMWLPMDRILTVLAPSLWMGSVVSLLVLRAGEAFGLGIGLFLWAFSLIVVVERLEGFWQPPWDWFLLGLNGMGLMGAELLSRKVAQLVAGLLLIAIGLFYLRRL